MRKKMLVSSAKRINSKTFDTLHKSLIDIRKIVHNAVLKLERKKKNVNLLFATRS